jgi:hypothetical protein
MSEMFGKNKSKKEEMETMKKQANKEYLQQSMQSYKYSKNSKLG